MPRGFERVHSIAGRLGMPLLALALLLALTTARAAAQENGQDRIKVVASFSILGDLVKNVGGDRIAVATLVGPGGDVHVYSPSPADARTLAAARLIVLNGLGFEGFIDRLVQASGTKAIIAIASAGVTPRRTGEGGAVDPHAWQAVGNAEIYVRNIRDALIEVDPPGREAYEADAAAYLARLDRLDRDVREAIATIPPARRKVITTHDAFGYFGAAYGIAFIAPLGVSTESEASARDIARIIRQVRQDKVPALFLENVSDPRLLQRIGAETGARIGGTLYADQLSGPDGPAPTYIDMIRHNVSEIVAALK
jgi:zinc/manganese transport system substrate-binding protein